MAPQHPRGSSRHQKDFQSPSFSHHIQCLQLLGLFQGPAAPYHTIRLPDKIVLSNPISAYAMLPGAALHTLTGP